MNRQLLVLSSGAALLAACSAPPNDSATSTQPIQTDRSQRGPSPAPAAASDYADSEYEEGFDLDPSTSTTAPSSFNHVDPQRPAGFPETWLYVRQTCGPTS